MFQASQPRQDHLALDSPEAKAFLATFFPGCPVRQVPLTQHLPPGQCYRNVRSVVTAKGGEAQAGWVLTWLPGHFIEALHHAVWRAPKGELQDVTAYPFPAMSGSSIAFIEDTQTQIGRYDHNDPCMPSMFKQLDSEAGTADYIDLVRRGMILAGQWLELMLKGVQFDAAGQIEFWPADPPPQVDVIETEQRQLETAIAHYRRRFNRGNFNKRPQPAEV